MVSQQFLPNSFLGRDLLSYLQVIICFVWQFLLWTSWKEKNKGLYKGKALTAYLNAKGKNLSKPKTVARATEKVGSGKQHLRSKVDTSRKAGELSAIGKAIVATVKQDDRSEKNLNRNFTLRQQQASNPTLKVFYALTSKQKLDVGKLIRKEGLTLSAAIKRITKGK